MTAAENKDANGQRAEDKAPRTTPESPSGSVPPEAVGGGATTPPTGGPVADPKVAAAGTADTAAPAAPTGGATGATPPAAAGTSGGPAKPAGDPKSGARSSTAAAGASQPASPTRSSATTTPSAGGGRGTGTPGGSGDGGSGTGGTPAGRGSGTPPPPRTGGGGWLGGLIGGVIGGVIAWVILTYAFPPAWQTEFDLLQVRVDELGEAVTGSDTSTEQLADLAGRVDALEAGAGEGLLNRVDELEAAIAQLQAGPATGSAALAPEVEERLSSLEEVGQQQSDLIERLSAIEGTAPSELSARIEAIETNLEQGAPSDQLAQVQERLAAVEADLASLAAGGGGDAQAGAEAAATMTQLREQIGALENELGTIRSEGNADRLSALDQRLAAAEETGTTVAALQDQVASLGGRVEELAGTVPEVNAQLTDAVESLADRVETIASNVEDLRQQVNQIQERLNGLDQRVITLDERLGGAEQSIQDAAARGDQAAALALAVNQIDNAIQQSAPYENPLATVRTLAADGPVADAVQQLEPSAASGVPGMTALRNQFDQVADEIVHASRSGGNGIFDQAADNLRRLVTVRPVGGDVEGSSAAARVARAEARLQDGDLQGAVQELEGLEGAAADAAQPWLEQARARLAAQSAVGQLQDHATGLLSQQP